MRRATISSQLASGRIRALAYIAAKRAPFLPDVPTMAEAGAKGMDLDPAWYGIFAPAGTPAAIVSRVHRDIRTALANPELRKQLAGMGVEPDGRAPAEFREFVQRTIKRSVELLRLAGIEPE